MLLVKSTGWIYEQEEHPNQEGNFQDALVVTEFVGGHPNVPFFHDVDIKELTKGDPDPVFVTLPIGKANATSGNKRHYDEKFLLALEEQVKQLKPIGIMGHIKEEDLGSVFPTEAVHWIGALRVKEYLWAKGYIPPGDARNRFQRYKATGKKIATSIFAKAEGVWDAALGAYKMLAETLALAQIDIAPADRAGIADLAAVPLLTREMAEAINPPPIKQEVTVAEKDEIVRGLTAQDAASLPKEVRDALIAEQHESMRQALGLPEGTDMVAYVKEMQTNKKAADDKAIETKITELAFDKEKGVKVEAVREIVIEMVTAAKPATVQDAERIYGEVVAKESIRKALGTHVQEQMGPPQGTGVQPQAGGKKGKYFHIPEVKA